MIWKVGHTKQCNNFSELETQDDGRVRPKYVVRRKGDINKLGCGQKYIVWNKWYSNAIELLNTNLFPDQISQLYLKYFISYRIEIER
jgi:hypothetical protein